MHLNSIAFYAVGKVQSIMYIQPHCIFCKYLLIQLPVLHNFTNFQLNGLIK
jgi:hypothetical protein